MISFDEKFWIAVSFVVFFALIFKPLKKAILGALDKRRALISSELDQAMQLKEEARRLLDSFQEKNKQALVEAEEIIKNAKNDAENILENGKKQLDDMVKKRIELVEQRIAQAEASAMHEIQAGAMEIAIRATRLLLLEQSSSGIGDGLIKNAVSNIEKKFH